MKKWKAVLKRTGQILLLGTLCLYLIFKVWIFNLTPDPPPNRSRIRPEISQVMWAVAGEKGEERLEHSSALLFFPKVLWMLLNDEFDISYDNGVRLTTQCIKTSFIKKEKRKNLERHFTNLFLTDAITSYWSYEDVVRCNYDYGNYGHGLVGFESAAKAYFSKEPAGLTLQEILEVELISYSPYLYGPCNQRGDTNRKRWLDRNQQEHKILQGLEITALKINILSCKQQ